MISSTVTTSEAAPADADGKEEPTEGGEEPAYAAGEGLDEVVPEQTFSSTF